MKSIVTLFAIFLATALMQAQEFAFASEAINYGNIEKNADGNRIFEFTNVGEAPLIIKQIKSSCGCTVAEKPNKPILPGEKGEIKISYDTKRLGGFSKVITVFSNAKTERKTLKIKGFIQNTNAVTKVD